MTPRKDPVPRARSPWNWLGGILMLGILGGGVVAASVLLWENLDIQGLVRTGEPAAPGPLPEPMAPLGAAVPTAGFEAFLYRSEATSGYYPDADFYPGALDRWEGLARMGGGAPARLGSADEVDALGGEGLLVAPAALCLDASEIDAFHRHVDTGGALVLTGATGARDGECEWRGWEALRDLTGALEAAPIEERAGLYFTVPGGIPLSAGIDPGTRVELRRDGQVALAADGPRMYWSDWALNASPAGGIEELDSAARMYALPDGGRVVWFGFSGGQGASPIDEIRIEQLFRNGLLWAAGVPSAELLPWPDGNRAALVLAQQVGWEFENAAHLATLAREKDVPVTFFVMSGLAADHPELADVLLSAGEVASQSSGDAEVAGFPFQEQQTRLRRSVEELQRWTGETPRGLRPPAERYDSETLHAWHDLGGSYLVGLNNGRTGSPELIETADGSIVLLPRLMKDDYNVIVQERSMSQSDLSREFLTAARKLHALGGLAVMSVHTQVAGSARRITAIAPVLDSVRADGAWWLATGGEVADWTLARRHATVTFRSWERDRIEVDVSAPPDRRIEGAWLDVALPGGSEEWEPRIDGVPVRYATTERGLAVPLPAMEAGEEQTVVLERPATEDSGGENGDQDTPGT